MKESVDNRKCNEPGTLCAIFADFLPLLYRKFRVNKIPFIRCLENAGSPSRSFRKSTRVFITEWIGAFFFSSPPFFFSIFFFRAAKILALAVSHYSSCTCALSVTALAWLSESAARARAIYCDCTYKRGRFQAGPITPIDRTVRI